MKKEEQSWRRHISGYALLQSRLPKLTKGCSEAGSGAAVSQANRKPETAEELATGLLAAQDLESVC